MPYDNTAMMSKALRERGPMPMQATEDEPTPEGCMCPDCPIKEKCMMAGGGPAEDMEGGEGMGGMRGMGGGRMPA